MSKLRATDDGPVPEAGNGEEGEEEEEEAGEEGGGVDYVRRGEALVGSSAGGEEGGKEKRRGREGGRDGRSDDGECRKN